MKTVVIGAHGQLGSDLVPRLSDDVVALGHDDIEITDPPAIARMLDALRPDVVINTAAYNLVDRAEQEPAAAFAVNAAGVRALARYCGSRDIVLAHVSTDYVFGSDEARRRPYTESDLPGPLGVYGLSKLAGEYFVRAACPRHFVIRTCGLYGRAATRAKGNFVETMLRLGAERPELRVVNDQRCTPTYTADLAQAIARLIRTEAYGLYHATNAGDATWYEFACAILRQAGLPARVTPITSAEYGAGAARPAYSVLDCRQLNAVIGSPLRDWQAALADYRAGRS